ncbi:MAG TPA: glutamate-1-semialdehyde 2,1-aminomutase [Candidatus Hydrogenedentes bacterium]|nr:glutamate-1-semialdehyde 2,1-aminomutase [Candidatus Hydrogenedentota bacterium]
MESRQSEQLFKEALEVMPGGVNSPVRAFKSVGGTPITFRRGEGAWLEDWDGNRYLDFCGSWGPLVAGHAHPYVRDRIEKALADGWTFGAPHRSETLLARKVLERVGFAEKIRFVNSGTEAVMTAVRLARGVTNRPYVVKFDGCYHGHLDSMLVNAGSGLATFGASSSAGVPAEIAATTLVAPLDDENAVTELFKKQGDKIAAVALETIPANNGLLYQRPEFLRFLRDITRKHGALLLLDEVLVGLRVHPGFAFQQYDVTPDIVTLGKVIGGGFPAAALAASAQIMEHLAPNGPVYQAGTLSGNPIAMTAGLATLEVLFDQGGWDRLMAVADRFQSGIEKGLAYLKLPVQYIQTGALFWFSFDSEALPRTSAAIGKPGIARYAKVHKSLLEKKIYFAPSGYEVGFLNIAMSDDEVDWAVSTILETIRECYG